MSDRDQSPAEGEVKSFHLADKEHSFHLVTDESHSDEPRSDDTAVSDEEVKSFHLAGKEHSFHKE